MQMTLREVNRHFSELAECGGLVLPSKLSYALACNLEKLQKEAGNIDKEREKLCRQYADKDEAGNAVMVDSVINGKKTREYQISEENWKAFEEEYGALLDTKIEIDIRKAKREEVERCEQAERYSIPTVAQLLALSFMLEE